MFVQYRIIIECIGHLLPLCTSLILCGRVLGTRSITFRASRSSFTVTTYQATFPSNLPRNRFELSAASCVNVRSPLSRNTARIVSLMRSYRRFSMFTPCLPAGCLVRIFVSTLFNSLCRVLFRCHRGIRFVFRFPFIIKNNPRHNMKRYHQCCKN
jgi:hypothetical protein